MTQINTVAVIGLGSIALRHRRNLKQTYTSATVLAMSASGRIPEQEVACADYIVSDIQSLIAAKPFMVIVASPSTLHAEHSIPLLEAGIPVLIEKPICATSSDALALTKAAERYNTALSVGYCLRYLSSAVEMKLLLDTKCIGTLYNVQADVGQFLPEWRADTEYKNSVSASAALGGGALLELSHELDYIQWLVGELKLNYGQVRNSSELDLEVEELADLVLTNKAGCVCYVHLDFLQKQPHRHCHFIGSQGRLNWDLLNNNIILHSANGTQTLYSEPEWDKNQMYLAMVDDFVRQITGQSHRCVTLKEAVTTVQLIEQIKQQAERGSKQ